MSQSNKLDALHVVKYLQEYPDFFNQHLELLETLTIPDPSNGNVVSLTAKQLDLFRSKQQKLEQQLKLLVAIAKENDISAGRIHKLTLVLLSSTSVEEAIIQLHKILTECFLIDFVALKIIAENANPSLNEFFIAPEHEDLSYLISELTHCKPRCGQLNKDQKQFLFAQAASQVKSCAIIPILFPELTALLVLGSCDEKRFHHSMGDLFLTQLSEIVGTRLMTLLKQQNN
jgi:uncharacterized protein YigA (DUF484 family)